MHSLRSHELYYPQHPTMYSDPTYYRAFGDPYLMQRIPPSTYLPSTFTTTTILIISSRAYRNMYSSSGINHYATAIASSSSQYRRSRSRSRSRHRYETNIHPQFYIDLFVYAYRSFSSYHTYASVSSFHNCISYKLTKILFSFKSGSYWRI